MEHVGWAGDRSRDIVRQNLARVRVVVVAGPLLASEPQRARVERLLRNRRAWGRDLPILLIATHSDAEEEIGRSFAEGAVSRVARVAVRRQAGHNESMGNAIALFQEQIDSTADVFVAKRHILSLTRRGGKGKAQFVSPFLGGQGTT